MPILLHVVVVVACYFEEKKSIVSVRPIGLGRIIILSLMGSSNNWTYPTKIQEYRSKSIPPPHHQDSESKPLDQVPVCAPVLPYATLNLCSARGARKVNPGVKKSLIS